MPPADASSLAGAAAWQVVPHGVDVDAAYGRCSGTPPNSRTFAATATADGHAACTTSPILLITLVLNWPALPDLARRPAGADAALD